MLIDLGCIDCFSNYSLITVFIHNFLFDFLSLDIVSQLTVKFFAKTLDHTTSIILKGTIDSRVSCRKCDITLTQNMIGTQNASDRQSA